MDCQAVQAKQIILTHGEKSARDWFMQELSDILPQSEIINPEPSRVYSI